MIHYNPGDLPHREFHQILLSGVSPRPIALVSSLDANGVRNLAPFSFFNAFASKPPVVAIGPAIAAATGREKDTLLNINETGECTISSVHHSFAHQMNLAATDYVRGVDEFVKSGLTPVASELVKPPFVAESRFVMECKLIQNIELFRELGGNGNIMLLRVLRIHVDEDVFTDGRIDPLKMDSIARMGYAWYTRVTPDVCFQMPQPRVRGIGIDGLPDDVRTSSILSGDERAHLASVVSIPAKNSLINADDLLQSSKQSLSTEEMNQIRSIVEHVASGQALEEAQKHRYAQVLLRFNLLDAAWQCLLS